MIPVVGVEQAEDRARIPENAAGHSARIAGLSRAPGALPPLRPAPASRKIGWFSENGGMLLGRRVWARPARASAGTKRRPPRRTLGRSPRWINLQTVERETSSRFCA